MRLLHDIWQLIRSWWHVDRIRVSPAEGRMLRLDPPCVILVEGTPVEVLRRLPATTDSSQVVMEYDCLCDGRKAKLIAGSHRAEITVEFVDHAKSRQVDRAVNLDEG